MDAGDRLTLSRHAHDVYNWLALENLGRGGDKLFIAPSWGEGDRFPTAVANMTAWQAVKLKPLPY